MIVKFDVKTDRQRFENELRLYVSKHFAVLEGGMEAQQGERVLYPSWQLRPVQGDSGARRVLYQGYRLRKSITPDGETETLTAEIRGIEYELREKAVNQTAVVATLLEPRLQEPFRAVLLEIGQEYAGSRAEIHRELGKYGLAPAPRIPRQIIPVGTTYRPKAGADGKKATNKGVEPPGARARRLGIKSTSKLARWDKIERRYVPEGKTQAQMAELEAVATETIRKDIAAMRAHPHDFPETVNAYPGRCNVRT